MYSEMVTSIITSIGGAAVIIGGLAHFLGKVWADRLAKQALTKYNIEFEAAKAANTRSLEEFKQQADSVLKDREMFGQISQETYQSFFSTRIATYQKLLAWKSEYISNMHEDFLIEEKENWGDVYYHSYVALRNLIIENQLYVSNELSDAFSELRMAAARYIAEADKEEGYALGAGLSEPDAYESREKHHEELANETHKLLSAVIDQIDGDVKKIRSRAEMDKA